MNRFGALWKPLTAIAFLLGSAVLLQKHIDAQINSTGAQKQELLVASGPLLKKLSLGYDALLADIYWTRAVQYYGSRLGKNTLDYDLLAPLLNITTALDPGLIVAYRFGAIFLSQPPQPGRTDLAIDLVKRGIAANPNEWRLYYDLGFLYYWRLKDYKDAEATYLAGSNIPGAPLFMKVMAARMAEKAGSIETSQILFTELYQSTEDQNIKKFAIVQLSLLKVQEDERQLDQAIQQFRRHFGRTPASLGDLASGGLLRAIPLDPAGYPYVIGPDGKSRLHPSSPMNAPKL